MTTSVRQDGQFDHVGLTLGALTNVSSYTTVLGGTHITARFRHGVVSMSKADATLLQRELLQALATDGWRPDVSGAVADLGEGA